MKEEATTSVNESSLYTISKLVETFSGFRIPVSLCWVKTCLLKLRVFMPTVQEESLLQRPNARAFWS
jgi:hypothetical protein